MTVCTDRAPTTLLAPLLPAAMLTDSTSAALFALAPLGAILADPAAPTLFALGPLATMLAGRASTALLAHVPAAAMLADPTSTALSAGVPLAVVVAQDDPVTAPALCTAALGVAAAAAIVAAADTRASAAPAAEAATEMPRQTVDQILLLPGLRQLNAEIGCTAPSARGWPARARAKKPYVARVGHASKVNADDHVRAARTSPRVRRDSGNTCGSRHRSQMELSSGSSQLSRS